MRHTASIETRRQDGFTLIEMIIAAVILIMLAAIAWPSYLEHVRRARRAEAIAVLMETMQQQERLYSERNQYSGFSREDGLPAFKWHSGATPESSSHEISAHPCGDQALAACVELRAVPGTAAVDPGFRDPTCGTLSLTSTGRRTPDDPRCWQ